MSNGDVSLLYVALRRKRKLVRHVIPLCSQEAFRSTMTTLIAYDVSALELQIIHPLIYPPYALDFEAREGSSFDVVTVERFASADLRGRRGVSNQRSS